MTIRGGSCALLLFALSACGSPTYGLTVSSPKPAHPKPANCEFRVLGAVPSGYEEVGIFSSTSPGYRAQTPEEFSGLIRKDVCQAGGDAVVAEVNSGGGYVRGILFRKATTP
jgi:phage terminase large subunit-like protein